MEASSVVAKCWHRFLHAAPLIYLSIGRSRGLGSYLQGAGQRRVAGTRWVWCPRRHFVHPAGVRRSLATWCCRPTRTFDWLLVTLMPGQRKWRRTGAMHAAAAASLRLLLIVSHQRTPVTAFMQSSSSAVAASCGPNNNAISRTMTVKYAKWQKMGKMSNVNRVRSLTSDGRGRSSDAAAWRQRVMVRMWCRMAVHSIGWRQRLEMPLCQINKTKGWNC